MKTGKVWKENRKGGRKNEGTKQTYTETGKMEMDKGEKERRRKVKREE